MIGTLPGPLGSWAAGQGSWALAWLESAGEGWGRLGKAGQGWTRPLGLNRPELAGTTH